MNNFIYIDIETIPSQKPEARDEIAKAISVPGNISKPETIAKWHAEKKPLAIEDAWRKTSFNGDRGEVVCIAWAYNDETPESVQRDVNGSEAELLGAFFSNIAKNMKSMHRLPTFIGHNVRDFDLRFLWHRAVILGVKPEVSLPHNVRPGDDRIYDTMTEWAGWGGKISLDRLCRALGIPLKGSELGGEEIDGSKVWDFVEAGRIDEVVAYCRADVERVRGVHQRMTFCQQETSVRAA